MGTRSKANHMGGYRFHSGRHGRRVRWPRTFMAGTTIKSRDGRRYEVQGDGSWQRLPQENHVHG